MDVPDLIFYRARKPATAEGPPRQTLEVHRSPAGGLVATPAAPVLPWVRHGHRYQLLAGRTDAADQASRAVNRLDAVLAGLGRGELSALVALAGPFSLAVLDTRPCAALPLVLYREPLGRRPIYYAQVDEMLLVARELAILLDHPAVSRDPDLATLDRHFAFRRPPGDRTPFTAIRALPPGCALTVDRDGRLETHHLARVDPRPSRRRCTDDDWIERFRDHLRRALRRTIDDVEGPPGIMLSSGLDSGALAALLARREPTGRAYSWSLPRFPEADETPAIRALADAFALPLTVLVGDRRLPFEDLEHWPVDPGTPTANAFRSLKLQLYAQAAADGTRVLLNGASGDLLYAHPRHRLRSALDDRRGGLLVREGLGALLGIGWGGPGRDPAFRALGAALLSRSGRAYEAPPWMSAPAVARGALADPGWPPEAPGGGTTAVYRGLLDRFAIDGACDENFFARRFGLDCRDPYRDPELVEFMLSAPAHLSWRGGRSKWLLRAAMKGLLPEPIRSQPRRGVLVPLFEAGFDAARPAFSRILEAPGAAWPEFVQRRWVERGLGDPRAPQQCRVLTWHCVAFELWRAALDGDQRLLAFRARGHGP